MTNEKIGKLLDKNIAEITKMETACGGMIRALIRELERNGPAYIALSNPSEGGNSISFQRVEGDETLLDRCARALGVSIDRSTLEI